MSKDIRFFSHLLLMVAGVLAIGGFALLMYILQAREASPKLIESQSESSNSQEKTGPGLVPPVYFDQQNLFTDEDFSLSFYYPQDWFVTDNGAYKKDEFLSLNPEDVLSGWIISTFNNPDYQLGKQAALIVKLVANPDNLTIKQWLSNVYKLSGELMPDEDLDLAYYYSDSRQQVYTQLPSGEFLIMTAPCGIDSKCLGDKEKNQEIFEIVLSSLSF